MASLAAHGKSNGMGGVKLSRYAGWWAFEHFDSGKGFDAGYKTWERAANCTSHLFFAYLRSQLPEPGSTTGILGLPRALQQLLDAIDYPPRDTLLQNDGTKVVMIVDAVSPTPFALLRRAKQFQYRDDDAALQQFSNCEDPIDALTEECRRVLRAISSTNQSHVSDAKTSTSLKDPSWSRFEDIGFGSAFEDVDENGVLSTTRPALPQSPSMVSRSTINGSNRPTTPSWADFLSSGFVDENGMTAPSSVLMPPEKALPPMSTVTSRVQSSQSHREDSNLSLLEPGELASIAKIELDDAFWWVWISSLAGEEPVARKAAFGRCALIETTLRGGQWMIMEEQVKGAAPDPIPGAYVAERKGFFSSFTKKGRLTRRRSALKKSSTIEEKPIRDISSRPTLDTDKQARIQQAAQDLARKQSVNGVASVAARRGRNDENAAAKTASVFTLGPLIKDEASPAMQWAKQYDKKAVREQYLSDTLAGRGSKELLTLPTNGINRSSSTVATSDKALPPAPQEVPEPRSTTPEPLQYTTASAPEPYLEHTAPAIPEAPLRPELTADEAGNPVMEQSHPQPAEKLTEPYSTDLPAPSSTIHEPVSTNAMPAAPVLPHGNTIASSDPRPSSRLSTESSRSGRMKTLVESRKKSSSGSTPVPPPVSTNKVSGMRKLFGTMRKKEVPQVMAAPSPVVKEDSAVARARRALEGKLQPGDRTASPPLSPNHFKKFQPLRDEPVRAAVLPSPAVPVHSDSLDEASDGQRAVPQTESVIPTALPHADEQSHHIYQTTATRESSVYPEAEYRDGVIEVPLHDTTAANIAATNGVVPVGQRIEETQHDQSAAPPPGPAYADRTHEYDDLSHVDSREREHAEREFSRFDQGPMTQQPAFYPVSDVPEEDEEYEDDTMHSFEPPHRPKHQSIYSTVTVETDMTDGEAKHELSQQISATDRWAQIRRNAAERAAQASEEHARSRTGTRTTDDGETSGEESECATSTAHEEQY